MTFDALIPEGRKDRADEERFLAASDAARKFADEPNGWLVFEGKTGSGKTHLAAAIVNAVIDRGAPAKFTSALDIPDLIRDQRFDDDEVVGTFEALLDAPLLVIDDLGAQQSAKWIDAKLDQLLTHRFNGRLPTVIVLARPLSEMPDRVSLRLDDAELSQIFNVSVESEIVLDPPVNIPSTMLERMTFDSFNPNGSEQSTVNDRESLNQALKAACVFVEQSDSTPWLYLHGTTGVGKTHLAVAVANELMKRDVSVTFWSVPDLLDSLRHTFSDPDQSAFFAMFDLVRKCEMLILDDFGAYRMTDWALDTLYQLIAYRHDRFLPTVITSHYILLESADNTQWDHVRGKNQWESICSRLNDSSVVTGRLMAAPDYRDRNR